MNLLQIAGDRPGQRYRVLVICYDDDSPESSLQYEMTSQVLELIEWAEQECPQLAENMSALLFEGLPKKGADFSDEDQCKRLYDDLIYELKAHHETPDGNYTGMRIAFFRDGLLPVFVCTNAFIKTSDMPTPPDEVSLARAEEKRYRKEKKRGNLHIQGISLGS